jgi:hypothetical protein
MAVSLERPADYKKDARNQNQQDSKAPEWRRPIAEPREEAKKAIEQASQGGDNNKNDRRDQNDQRGKNADNRGNKQNKGGGNDNNRQNNQNQQQDQRPRIDPHELLDANKGKAKVVVQNSGETRALVTLALDLDKRFAFVRENMFGRLPGEYGALALYDIQAQIDGLRGVSHRLATLGVPRKLNYYDKKPIKMSPASLQKFHYEKIRSFLEQLDKLSDSFKALGFENDVLREAKEALATYEAKVKAEREAKEAKEREEIEARRQAKAQKQAEWEQRQAQRKAEQAARQAQKSETTENSPSQEQTQDLPSLTDTALESEKPTKAKKEKATA